MLFCFPLFYYTGVSTGFYAGQFTRQFENSSDIGYAMALLGGCAAVGSIFFGKISDVVSKYRSDAAGIIVVLIMGMFVQGGALFTVWVADKQQNWLLYVAGGLLGIADCSFQSMMYKVVNNVWSGSQVADALAAFKFTQSLASAICFLYSPLLVDKVTNHSTRSQLFIEIAITGGICVIGVFSFTSWVLCFSDRDDGGYREVAEDETAG